MDKNSGDKIILEYRALKLSIVGALGMAALGILFAVLTRSEAVLLDGFFSSAVCIAFIILVLVEKTRWSVYTPYAEPLIVLVFLAAPIPIRVVRQSLREVLLGAPEPDFQNRLRSRINAATTDLPIESTVLRMVKVGRSFYIHAYLLVRESHGKVVIEELDAVRERIASEVSQVVPHIAIDVIFTRDPKWAQPFDSSLRMVHTP
jgi:predicted Co/Zn/Cd cation transporter (cation efflux family)